MSDLAFTTMLCGGCLLAIGGAMTLWPHGAAAMVRALPRNVWAGRVLAAVDIVWSTWLLLQMGFGWVDAHAILVYAAAPIVYLLVIIFVDDLLAARALGGLLLLLPLPILESACIHHAGSRLIMAGFAYLLVIVGIVLVWSPFKWRQWTEAWINRTPVTRAAGLIGLFIGGGMLLLAWRVY